MATKSIRPVIQAVPGKNWRAVFRLQWIPMAVVMLAASLNYFDRQLLSGFAPTIKAEFALDNAHYGQVVGAFALAYAVSAPLTGFVVDYAGLRWGVVSAVTFWSLFSSLTGYVGSLSGLVTARAGLAVAESAILPAISKAGALYLDPAELGLSSGFGAGAITLGVATAPLLAAFAGPSLGWRCTFFLTGSLGLVWVAVWLIASSRIPQRREALQKPRLPYRKLLRDRRLWGTSAAWALALLNFAVWSSWITIFLVERYGMSEVEANRRFAWLPPLFSVLGGFAGGIWVFKSIRCGREPLRSRLTNTSWMALLVPATALAPWMPTPALAVSMIGISYLGSFAISGNTNVMPIDMFGAPHAGVAASIAAGVYALLQAALGPLMGLAIDHAGFKAGFAGLGLLSVSGVFILRLTMSGRHAPRSEAEVLASHVGGTT